MKSTRPIFMKLSTIMEYCWGEELIKFGDCCYSKWRIYDFCCSVFDRDHRNYLMWAACGGAVWRTLLKID